jgi:lipopolysaccharide biosynthesis glycosyltransferase
MIDEGSLAVCYVTGEGIYNQTIISIYSLLANNPENEFEIYIIDSAYNQKFSRNIQVLSANYPEIELSYRAVEEEYLDLVPRDAGMFHWSTNIRLLLPRLVPDEIEWILYLDYDTIVDDDIMPITQYLKESLYVAGVMEEVRLAQTDIDKVVKYINAGVLIMNATLWREDGLCEFLLEYVRDVKPKYADQNAINSQIDYEQIGLLPLQYNISRRMWDNISPELETNKLRPRIYHFWGPWKPWHKFSHHELDSTWQYYYNKCPIQVEIDQYKSGWLMDVIESIILQNMDFDAKLRRIINRILFS